MKKLKELRAKLGEVSAKKLTNYIGLSVDNKGKLKKSGAAGSLEKAAKASADAFARGDKEAKRAATKTVNKRAKGLQMARAKLDKKVGAGSRAKVPATEAVQYPHMMYDPKTGKEVTAKTPADHNKNAKMGYTHEKPTNEAVQYKVDVEGLPPTFMTGKSTAEIMAKLRKIVKQPSMIKSVERHTDAEVKKAFRNKAQGREIDEANMDLYHSDVAQRAHVGKVRARRQPDGSRLFYADVHNHVKAKAIGRKNTAVMTSGAGLAYKTRKHAKDIANTMAHMMNTGSDNKRDPNDRLGNPRSYTVHTAHHKKYGNVEEAGTPERLAMIRKAGEKINKEKKKAERDAKRAMAKDKDLMGENKEAAKKARDDWSQRGRMISQMPVNKLGTNSTLSSKQYKALAKTHRDTAKFHDSEAKRHTIIQSKNAHREASKWHNKSADTADSIAKGDNHERNRKEYWTNSSIAKHRSGKARETGATSDYQRSDEAVIYHGNPNKDDDARNAARRKRLAKQDNKVKLKGFGPDAAKGNMGNPVARASLRTEASVVPSKDGKKLVPMKKHSGPKSEPVPNDQFGLPKLQKEAVYGSQAQRMMSPLQKARQDKEKADRDRHGNLNMMKGRPKKKKLGEISMDLKQRYADKAKSDYGHQQFTADIAKEMGAKDAEKHYRRKQRNRMAGIARAKK